MPGGNHAALGDCKATLKVILAMAQTPLAVLQESENETKQGNLPPIYQVAMHFFKKIKEYWK